MLQSPTPTPNNPPFLRIRQFVSVSGISEKRIREMVMLRQIPFIKSGNRYLIDRDGALTAIREMAARGNA